MDRKQCEARLRWFRHVQRSDVRYVGRRMLRMKPSEKRKVKEETYVWMRWENTCRWLVWQKKMQRTWWDEDGWSAEVTPNGSSQQNTTWCFSSAGKTSLPPRFLSLHSQTHHSISFSTLVFAGVCSLKCNSYDPPRGVAESLVSLNLCHI